jgi:hypothetical protein
MPAMAPYKQRDASYDPDMHTATSKLFAEGATWRLQHAHRHDIKIRNKRHDFHHWEAKRGFRRLGDMNTRQAGRCIIKHKRKQSRGI